MGFMVFLFFMTKWFYFSFLLIILTSFIFEEFNIKFFILLSFVSIILLTVDLQASFIILKYFPYSLLSFFILFAQLVHYKTFWNLLFLVYFHLQFDFLTSTFSILIFLFYILLFNFIFLLQAIYSTFQQFLLIRLHVIYCDLFNPFRNLFVKKILCMDS